jgi:hypothetical protein
MRRTLISCSLLLSALAAGLSHAEPGRVARWLMDEPMSMFDWGLYKTDKAVANLKSLKGTFPNEFFFASADYDWELNRIRIRVSFHGKGTDAECIENIKRAKGAFLNYTWNERDQPKAAKDVFAALFSHEGGYKSKNQPSDLGEQLANMSVLEATIYVPGEGGSYTPRARCSMGFRSSEVSVVRQ